MRFSIEEIEESKRLIREEISSDEELPNTEEEKQAAAEESDDNSNSDSEELDLEAIEAERAAKKAKKLLPKKTKLVSTIAKPESIVNNDGVLVVNMDYVQTKARKQYKNK